MLAVATGRSRPPFASLLATPLKVLKAAGVKDSAIYTAHYGADMHLSGQAGKLPISRGVPIKKALDSNNLITFAMNGEPIHPMNGAPLRLHIPGWPGSFSHKWFNRLQLRDVVHDGPKMTGSAYRLPPHPVAPGTKVDRAPASVPMPLTAREGAVG